MRARFAPMLLLGAGPDVFRFFYDQGITYCRYYDHQMWTESEFRVASAITSEGSKKFDELVAQDPRLYERIQAIFPGTDSQRRYRKDYAGGKPAESWHELRVWIDDNLAGKWHTEAHRAVNYLETRGVPLEDAWKFVVVRSEYKRSSNAYQLVVAISKRKGEK